MQLDPATFTRGRVIYFRSTIMETEIIFRGEKIYRRNIAEVEMQLSEEKLKSLLNSQMVIAKNYCDKNVKTLIDVAEDIYYTIFPISAIILRAEWHPFDDNGKLAIRMAREASPETLFLEPIFTTPLWMKLYGVIEQRSSMEVRILRMYMRIRDVDALLIPPLPNIYDDGELCTGENFNQRMDDKNINERIQAFNDILNENPWGKDLWKDVTKALVFHENADFPGGYRFHESDYNRDTIVNDSRNSTKQLLNNYIPQVL